MSDPLLTIPNLLTLSHLPLAVVLFARIACEQWLDGFLALRDQVGLAQGKGPRIAPRASGVTTRPPA